MNTQSPINTDYILQADRRGGGRYSVSCRESMMRNLAGLLGEYPSERLVYDRTTISLVSIYQISAFLPDRFAIDGGVDGGPAGFAVGGFRKHADIIRLGCQE